MVHLLGQILWVPDTRKPVKHRSIYLFIYLFNYLFILPLASEASKGVLGGLCLCFLFILFYFIFLNI